jgi:hypothetical protein
MNPGHAEIMFVYPYETNSMKANCERRNISETLVRYSRLHLSVRLPFRIFYTYLIPSIIFGKELQVAVSK